MLRALLLSFPAIIAIVVMAMILVGIYVVLDVMNGFFVVL